MKTNSTSWKLMLFASLTFILTGCLETEVPLSSKADRVPSSVIGTWIKSDQINEKDKDVTKFKVALLPGNQNLIKIEEISYSTEMSSWNTDRTYVGHFTRIGDDLFISYCEPDASALESAYTMSEHLANTSWRICKISSRFNPFYVQSKTENLSLVKLRWVTENILEEINEIPVLYNLVASHKDLSWFYDKDDDLVWIKSE